MAIAGFFVGAVLTVVVVSVVGSATHAPLVKGSYVQTPAVTAADLVGLWAGLLGAVLVAGRLLKVPDPFRALGLSLRLWPDVPLGVAVGLGSQYGLIRLLYLPLQASHPHLDQTLSREGVTLTSNAHGAGLVLVAVLVGLGAPVMEELFFRGLLLQSLEAWLSPIGRRAAPVVAVVVMGVAFGFAHSEGWLVAYGLAVFGMVLGVMAKAFRRLGPGIVAHAAFNLASVVTLAAVHLK